MRIYLAASYSRRKELCGYAEVLKGYGHEITSRWLNGAHEAADENPTQEEMARWATEDISDIQLSDALIAFTEPPKSGASRGGRHVELGYAIAIKDIEEPDFMVFTVGPVENIFCALDDVVNCNDLNDVVEYIELKKGEA